MSVDPVACYDDGIRSQVRNENPGWLLRSVDGRLCRPALARWCGDLVPGDQGLVDRCTGPTIDLGCGPGRILEALTRSGIPALGVDISAEAVRQSRARGGSALRRDLFARLPGERRWDAVVLIDGNVGIGGDPCAVLARARELLRLGGRVLCEASGPGAGSRRLSMRFEKGRQTSDWFPWAVAAVDDVSDIGARVGFAVHEVWTEARRWFIALEAI